MSIEGPMIRRALLLLALVPTVAACGSGTPGSAAPSGPPPSPTRAAPSGATGPTPPDTTTPAPASPSASPVTGEVPAGILDLAKADLARRTGLDPATFVVVRADEVVWSDGSLGCPVPGQAYIQMITPGYWIGLQAGGAVYDYRATKGGLVRLCDQPNAKPPSG